MLIKTKAIVLRAFKYGESQLIVDTLTESHGRLSFILRIPKTGRSRIRKQLFQPMSVLLIEMDYRQRQRLQKIREATMAYPLSSLPFDARKLTIALFLAEFTLACTRAEQQDAPLFAFVENSVRWLDAAEGAFANFHIIYILRFSQFAGFYPNLEDGREGDFFDLRDGCYTATSPLHPDFLRPEEAEKIRLLMRLSYNTMHLLALSRTERNHIVETIIRYYSLHVPDFPELRSLSVLRELFA